MNYIIIFDVIITGMGAYVIFSALQMKKKGEISSLLVNRELIVKCKDKKGFIGKIYQKMIIFGLISIGFGLLGCINDMVYNFGRIYEIVSVMVYLIVCLLFSREVRKEAGEYFK